MRILDTDVCIEILRDNARVITRRRNTLDRVATTWITAAELYYGAAKSRIPQSKTEGVRAFLGTLPVFGFDEQSVRHFGRVKAALERAGQGLTDAALLIGSDLPPCIASGLKLGSVSEREETDDEAEPVYGSTDHRDAARASGRDVCGRSVPQARDLGGDILQVAREVGRDGGVRRPQAEGA